MYAVVVNVVIHDRDKAMAELKTTIVPRAAQAPGLVGGYWLALDDAHGLSILVFESHEQAQAMTGQIVMPPEAPVTLESVRVSEVVAHT